MSLKTISFVILLVGYLDQINCSRETDCNLPSDCSLKSISQTFEENKTFYYSFLCNGPSLNLNLNLPLLTSNATSKCLIRAQKYNNFYFAFKDLVMLKDVNLKNIIEYLNSFETQYAITILKAENGIYISDNEKLETTQQAFLKYLNQIILRRTKFIFYSGDNKLIRSCQDFRDLNITWPKTIFHLNFFAEYTIFFSQPIFKNEICPFVFNNSIIQALFFAPLIDTFFWKNIPRFSTDISNQPLNITIKRYFLELLENVNIDSTIMNKNLFKEVILLYILGDIRSIEENVFVSMDKIERIMIQNIKKISHKQGIKWMANMNTNLKVNLSDQSQLDANMSQRKVIDLFIDMFSSEKQVTEAFPDEDFCLYKDFPFDQLIILAQISFNGNLFFNDNTSSCTYAWLAKYFKIFVDNRFIQFFGPDIYPGLIGAINITEGNRCDFNLLLSKCDKKQFQISQLPDPFNRFHVRHSVYFFLLLCFFGSVIVSVIGIFTNGVVVFIISHKKNKKELDEQRHFHFMRMNALMNICIFIIHLLNLMTECNHSYEVYCSTIRRFVPIQLVRIALKEFLGTALILMSSLSYIAFTLNRIALLGKEHGKIVNWISNICLKRFTVYCSIISLLTSVVKIFKYKLNLDSPGYDYPIQLAIETSFIFNIVTSQIYLVVDFVSDLMVSLVYIVLQLIVDICLVYQLKTTLESKMKSSQTQKQKELLKKKNDSAINRAIVMVILNAAFNLILKAPTCVIPLYNMISFKYQQSRFSSVKQHPLTHFHLFYCEILGICNAFEELSKFLFLVSLTLNIIFFYNFDNMFKNCFFKIFPCKKNK